ncbi:hypothetical protein E2C01_089824 [Portunus trituberculatus]|uniref:Uncharacterized protein n=1 Tax=Portunus trituberculatus TaxID=210409 RepID=A0A5B7JK57_PORTR|nr:hypothetical protein [Portunus trituberculatus]
MVLAPDKPKGVHPRLTTRVRTTQQVQVKDGVESPVPGPGQNNSVTASELDPVAVETQD